MDRSLSDIPTPTTFLPRLLPHLTGPVVRHAHGKTCDSLDPPSQRCKRTRPSSLIPRQALPLARALKMTLPEPQSIAFPLTIVLHFDIPNYEETARQFSLNSSWPHANEPFSS